MWKGYIWMRMTKCVCVLLWQREREPWNQLLAELTLRSIVHLCGEREPSRDTKLFFYEEILFLRWQNCWHWGSTVVFHSTGNLNHWMAQSAHAPLSWCSVLTQATSCSVNFVGGVHVGYCCDRAKASSNLITHRNSISCCVYPSTADWEMPLSARLSSE